MSASGSNRSLTFGSRLAMEGVDLLTIKELGGWRSLSMVSRYAHLSLSHRNQAIRATGESRSERRRTGSRSLSSTVISTWTAAGNPNELEVCEKRGAGGGS